MFERAVIVAAVVSASTGVVSQARAGTLYMRMAGKEIRKVFPPSPPEKRSAQASPRGVVRRNPKPGGPPIGGGRRAARRFRRRAPAMFIAATTAPYYVAPYAAPYGVFYPAHGLGHLGFGHHVFHHGDGHALAGLLHHAVHHP